MDNGPGAHGTWFFGHEEVTVGQPPVTDCGLSGSQGEHLSMSRGILEEFNLIVAPCDDPAFMDNYGSNRHFCGLVRKLSLPESLPHKVIIRFGY